MAKRLLVTQIRSRIGIKPKLEKNLRALGLKKINANRVHDDNPVIRGMIQKVKHLVSVKEIKE